MKPARPPMQRAPSLNRGPSARRTRSPALGSAPARPPFARAFSAWLALASCAACLFVVTATPTAALAQRRPTVVSSSTATRVEVGESFQISLQARGEAGFFGPQLSAPPEFRANGPSISLSQFDINGNVQSGLTATWTLVPEREGKFMIPGPTVRQGSERLRTAGHAVEVVASTGRHKRGSSMQFPLGPGGQGFSFQFHWPFGGQADDDEDGTTTDKSLDLPEALDPMVFLRAVADKTDVVVGEQVTLSFYVYSRIDVEMSDRQEAPLTGFARLPLLKANQEPPRLARVGRQIYSVRLLDRVAAFPLRAGELKTGTMKSKMTGRRIGSRVPRLSQDLTIKVRPPPEDGRPPGYVLGDVGQFSLSSSVAPRSIAQGGTVAVTLKIVGDGNFPQRLRVPERTNVEWLDPERKDAIEPQEGKIAGSRTLNYVVRVSEAGTVDLGTVELPFWDPVAKRYETTRTSLGSIEVTAVAPSPTGAGAGDARPGDSASQPLAKLPPPRTKLEPFEAPKRGLATGPLFFLLLAAAPLAVAIGGAGLRVAALVQGRAKSARESAGALAQKALAEADGAAEKRDVKTTAVAAARAVHAALEQRTGVKTRGLLLSDLARELEAAELDVELAKRARDLLEECATIGFAPVERGKNPAADLAKRARELVADVRRGRRG